MKNSKKAPIAQEDQVDEQRRKLLRKIATTGATVGVLAPMTIAATTKKAVAASLPSLPSLPPIPPL
jgi:hypothetical protein